MANSPLLLPQDTIQRVKSRDPSLILPEKEGCRRISLDLMSPTSTLSSRTASSTSSSKSAPETIYIKVPVHLNSIPAAEFLGLTSERAELFYAGFAKLQERVNVELDIERYVCGYVREACKGIEDNTDDWDLAMREAGIAPKIRNALMKEEHRMFRGIQSLSDWLTEAVRTNCSILVDLNQTILDQLSSPNPRLRGGGDEDYTIPQTAGDRLALFKSVAKSRCRGLIAEDGQLDLGVLWSDGPTDFARHGGLYFTHQLWVAKHYSDLINDMCQPHDRRTVEIHVPLKHFDKMKAWKLKFEDDEFKQMIFYSRRKEKFPKYLSKKRAQHDVVIGPIAHTHNLSFGKMSSWTEIRNSHLLTEDEKSEDMGKGKDEASVVTKIGIQYAWFKDEAIECLEHDVRGFLQMRKPQQGFKLIPEPWLNV